MQAIPTDAVALNFDTPRSVLQNRLDPNRDKIRYVACLGNHLEPGDARQLNSNGGWAGGLWCGHSEIGGVPTMTRTHHMVLRGLFTPLETRAVMRKADHREQEAHRESYLDGPGIPPFTRGYTVFAGDDLAYLQSDRYRPMGVVEISALFDAPWDSELRRNLQNHFFPQWMDWQRGVGEVPELLTDWEALVHDAKRRAQFQSHDIVAEELFESIRLFKNYAFDQIEKNRQIIQSMRMDNNGGQYVGWHNKTRLYAAQLGIVLEDEQSLAAASSDPKGLVEEMRADRKLREKELDVQREQTAILLAKLTGEEYVPAPKATPDTPAVAPPNLEAIAQSSVEFGDVLPITQEEPIQETDQLELSPIEDFNPDLTPGCSENNSKGEPCKAKVHAGHSLCTFHEKEKGVYVKA